MYDTLIQFISTLGTDHFLALNIKEGNDIVVVEYLNNKNNGTIEVPPILTLAEFKKAFSSILPNLFTKPVDIFNKWRWVLDFFLKDVQYIETNNSTFQSMVGMAVLDELISQENASKFGERLVSISEKYLGRNITIDEIRFLR